MVKFANTLGNKAWMHANEIALKEILPADWTLVSQELALQMAYRFKLLGIDWRTFDEFGGIMVWLEKIGFMLRDGLKVKRNPNSVFHPVPSLN